MSSEGDAMYGVSTVDDGATTSHTGDTEGHLYKYIHISICATTYPCQLRDIHLKNNQQRGVFIENVNPHKST